MNQVFNVEIPTLMSGNCAFANNVLARFYQVQPLLIKYADSEGIERSSSLHASLIRKINADGGMILLPKLTNLDQDYEYLLEQVEQNRMPEPIKEQGRRLIEAAKSGLEGTSFYHDQFFYTTRNRPEFTGNIASRVTDKITGYKRIQNGKQILRDKATIAETHVITKTLKESRSIPMSPVGSETLGMMLRQIEFPVLNANVLDWQYQECANHLEYTYKVKNPDSSVTTRNHYARYYLVSDLGGGTDITNDFSNLVTSNLPLSTFVKYCLRPNKEYVKEIDQKLEENAMYKKKYQKANNGRKNKNYDKHEDAALEAKETFEASRESAIETQVIFRLDARSLQLLEIYEAELLRKFELNGLEHQFMVGRQALMYHQSHPLTMEDKTHNKLILPSFGDLNIFSGESIGDTRGILAMRSYVTNAPVKMNTKNLITADTKNKSKADSTTTIIIGGTGSGKTVKMWNFSNWHICVSGRPQLKVSAKNDDAHIGENSAWIRPYMQFVPFGNSEEYAGCMDAFLVYEDLDKARNAALLDIQAMCKSLMPDTAFNMALAGRAINKMLERTKAANLRPTMNEFLYDLQRLPSIDINAIDEAGNKTYTELSTIDPMAFNMAENLETLRGLGLGQLFFADQHTHNPFDYEKIYSSMSLQGIPKIDQYDEKNMNHVLANQLILRIERYVELYLEYWNTRGFSVDVIIDELKVLAFYPGIKTLVESLNLMIRSQKDYLWLLMQNATHIREISHSILNNYAQVFIGKLENMDEVEFVEKYFQIPKTLSRFFIQRMQDADVRGEASAAIKDYPFVYKDYNDKKAIVESVITTRDIFEDMQSHEEERSSVS